jgi:hypothetical protein
MRADRPAPPSKEDLSVNLDRGRGNTKSLALTRTWRTVLLSSGEAPATSYTQNGGSRMRCLEVRGAPFGREDKDTRRLVDRLNASIHAHYGHAGPAFVAWLMRHRQDWGQLADQYRESIERYAERADAPQAGRLAAYAGAIDVAASVVHEALHLPFAYRDPLENLWDDIAGEAADAGGDTRALRDVMSWAHAHMESFVGRHKLDGGGEPRTPPGGWAGRWEVNVRGQDDEAWESIAFHPTVLKQVLREQDYEPEAILAGWRERGWLEVGTDRRRYTKQIRVLTERPHMVVIRREAVEEAGA